jgi:hypothetical protein
MAMLTLLKMLVSMSCFYMHDFLQGFLVVVVYVLSYVTKELHRLVCRV